MRLTKPVSRIGMKRIRMGMAMTESRWPAVPPTVFPAPAREGEAGHDEPYEEAACVPHEDGCGIEVVDQETQ